MPAERRSIPAALAVVALLTATAPAVARLGRSVPYGDGDRVTITGLATDGAGQPIADLEVVLEAARRRFSVAELATARKHVVRRSTATNARGEFSLDWTWDGYYDDFRLQAEIPVRVASGEKREVLARLDLSQRILAGSPVPASLVVEDTRFLHAFRAFLAGLTSDDQRRAYEMLGKPDSIDTFVDPRYTEEAWWYFASGKVVRFRDGRTTGTTDFAPVRPF